MVYIKLYENFEKFTWDDFICTITDMLEKYDIILQGNRWGFFDDISNNKDYYFAFASRKDIGKGEILKNIENDILVVNDKLKFYGYYISILSKYDNNIFLKVSKS